MEGALVFFFKIPLQNPVQQNPHVLVGIIFIRRRIAPEHELHGSHIFCQQVEVDLKPGAEHFPGYGNGMALIRVDYNKITIF